MANTSIKIKRSTTTSSPVSLAAGELAYSYLSNTIFIGSPAGTGVLNVGGQYYTSQVDSATDLNTGGTLVRRDPTGNVSFNIITANTINGTIVGSLTGNANSATQLQTARDFSISGGDISASAVSFNGTQNVTLNASLNSIAGLSAGVYGGTTAIPVVTVAANGRVMAISNTSISTSFGIAGDTGTDTVNGGDTIYFVGGDGITTAVTNNTISYAVDTTVFRSNTAIAKQNIDGDVQISGNLIVLGTQTTVNVATLSVDDSLIALAKNNVSDIVDIGFYGHYNDGTNRHAGVYRHAGTQEFYVFDNYTQEPAANTINPASNNFRVATLNANLKSQFANVTTLNVSTINATTGSLSSLSLGSALSVPSGGTGATSFTNGSIIVGSGTGALATLANSNYSATGSGASNNTVSSLTVDAYGRLTAATFEAISGLTVGQGGTGVSSFTAGQLIVGDGSNGLKQISNTTYVQTGTLATSNTITAITVDAYGRLTAATTEKIALDTSQITSGTLGVSRGGTGASTLSAGGLLIGNGTGAISTLANTTYTLTGTLGAAKTITSLTVDAYGRLTAATASDISGLTVSQGGTGASTFSTNGIVYGNGTGAMQVTAAAGTSDQTWSNQILTVTNAGVPVWSSALDGGQF